MDRPEILTKDVFLSRLKEPHATTTYDFYCRSLAEQRELLRKVREERDALSLQRLQFAYLEGDLRDPESFDFIEDRMRKELAENLKGATVPNNRSVKKTEKMKTGKSPMGDERISLRVAMGEMLTEHQAMEAITTAWEGENIGKGDKGAKNLRKQWPKTFPEVENRLAGYIGSLFKGARPEVCITYARLSFGNTHWYPYENPSATITYPDSWGL